MGYPGPTALVRTREALENVPETTSPTKPALAAPSPRASEATPRPPGPVQNGEAHETTAVEPGRGLRSAWHGLAVIALGLGLSLLLNAPGIHKTAYNQPDGWTRDAALAVTGPLADASRALRLDRPRAAVKGALGRSDDDGIDTEIEIAVPVPAAGGVDEGSAAPKPAPATPSVQPAEPARPVRPAFTAATKLRVWIAGDSLVITPGYAILRAAGENPAIRSVGTVDGRLATGLSRPDVFNWFKHVSAEVRRLEPHVVVLAFGANDDKAYMTGAPAGVRAERFGDAVWRREYRRRLGVLFDGVSRVGAHVVWIGLPLTRNPRQTARFEVINAAVVAEAEQRPGKVSYIDTFETFAGPGGRYAEYLERPAGGVVKVRASDGVHFERAGGEIVARRVLDELNRVFDLGRARQ